MLSSSILATEGEVIALIGVLAALAAGVPAAIAAVITQRTRRENSEQHGKSVEKLDRLHDAIVEHGIKVDDVKDEVTQISARVDRHAVALGEQTARLEEAERLLGVRRLWRRW